MTLDRNPSYCEQQCTSQKGRSCSISATQESFLLAERMWGRGLWERVPDKSQKAVRVLLVGLQTPAQLWGLPAPWARGACRSGDRLRVKARRPLSCVIPGKRRHLL